jgi:hypothetical protein
VKRYGKYGGKGKLNSEMIWKIWKISVLVLITPKDTSSSTLLLLLLLILILLLHHHHLLLLLLP